MTPISRVRKILACQIFLVTALLARTFAEDMNRATNDSAATGEPSAKETSTKTNVATATPPSAPPTDGRVASLAAADLREYESQPPEVKRLLERALGLTTLGLSYQYGSCDPKNGGMDCSGTVYYLLNDAGLKDVPRDSSEMYEWVWQRSRFQAVTSSNPDTFELASLKPGDLLFWTGTYKIDRDPPITHVMIYLGINRHSGHRVMFGASEGRQFEGKSRYGVSVFDFTLPKESSSSEEKSGAADLHSRFIGYGSIPGLVGTTGSEDTFKKHEPADTP